MSVEYTVEEHVNQAIAELESALGKMHENAEKYTILKAS